MKQRNSFLVTGCAYDMSKTKPKAQNRPLRTARADNKSECPSCEFKQRYSTRAINKNKDVFKEEGITSGCSCGLY